VPDNNNKMIKGQKTKGLAKENLKINFAECTSEQRLPDIST
jgi:hypothetical protein